MAIEKKSKQKRNTTREPDGLRPRYLCSLDNSLRRTKLSKNQRGQYVEKVEKRLNIGIYFGGLKE
jgi:hypothetical protein